MKTKTIWKKNRFASVGLLCALFASAAAFAGADVEIEIDEEDRCPVCAMRVILYPTFAASAELCDGRKFKFCSNGCLIRSLLHPEAFLGVERKDIAKAWVQDYFTGRRIDGHTAVWVWGSDVIGPMGPEPVPLASEKDLKAFQRRHGAKTVFDLKELTPEKWEEITGQKETGGQ